MRKVVLDASVFIMAFHKDEVGTESAQAFLHELLENEVSILVPRIFYYEVFGFACREHVDVEKLSATLAKYEASCLSYVAEDDIIHQQILTLTKRGNPKSGYPTFHDSSYHAIAMHHRCDLVTADKRHFEKVKDLGYIRLLG